MREVEIDEIVTDLKEVFNILEKPTGENVSYVSNGKFGIDKRVFERGDVLAKLGEYFSDKVVKGGYVQVDPITMVTTGFHIKEGIPEQYK